MSHHRSYHLHVAADSDNTLLVRVCGALASLGLVPESFRSRRIGGSGDRTGLVIVVIGASPQQVDLLERKLLQMTQVIGVETCESALNPRSLRKAGADRSRLRSCLKRLTVRA